MCNSLTSKKNFSSKLFVRKKKSSICSEVNDDTTKACRFMDVDFDEKTVKLNFRK